MSRYAAPIGSALALAALTVLAVAPQAAASAPASTYTFAGQRFAFTTLLSQPGGRAVALDDPGLRGFLAAIGASVTWQKGERYILVTTAQPLVVTFSLGDTRYDAGPVTEEAPFAPFLLNGHAYLAFESLVRALGFAFKGDLLQPQLTSLDVETTGGGTHFIARGGMPLDATMSTDAQGNIVIKFDEVGSALPSSRPIGGGPVTRIDVRTEGTELHPHTIVTLRLAPGTTHGAPATDDQRDLTLAFNGAPALTQATPPAPSQPQPQATTLTPPDNATTTTGPAQITSVRTQPGDDAFTVQIAISGNAAYEWHRLRPPDNRLWVDVHGSKLMSGPSDIPGNALVASVRVRQQTPDTVRIALSPTAFNLVDVTPQHSGITLVVHAAPANIASALRSGSGTVGTNAVAVARAPWKFTQRATPAPFTGGNPRLIVIDPGHGGSDWGSIRGDAVEKNLALDMSKRLRDILVSRGWQVMMTRETDRDVFAPNDSDRDELQARDDVANMNGARLFVSIHVNAFMNSGPHGATVYYYKPIDLAFAQAVERRIAAEGGIQDDGTVKDKLYVVHHATMPATLVETAFISNPDDRVLLASSEWRQKMARAIADGITDYAGPPPPVKSGGGGE